MLTNVAFWGRIYLIIPDGVNTGKGSVMWFFGSRKPDFEIEDGVLKKYNGKDRHVDIPDSVTEIGVQAFQYRDSIASITIPDSVKHIGSSAFWGCSSLKSINIPYSVTSIEYGTFGFCKSLVSIRIPASVVSIGGSAFFGCSSLIDINIPEGIKEIDSHTFEGCDLIREIIIPDSVTSIGTESFRGCLSLEKITIPNSVTIIDYGAFYMCSALQSVKIPDSVVSIEPLAFNCCFKATIIVPESVTDIGENAFGGCKDVIYQKSNESLKNHYKYDNNSPTYISNKYVFISYKSEEITYAEAMKSLFKENGIRAWMAPDDIPTGAEYAIAINDGIKNSSCVLLILSKQSQSSRHVLSEVRIAFDSGKTIFSVHIDDSVLTPAFEYYLGNDHITPIRNADKNDPNVQKILADIKKIIK